MARGEYFARNSHADFDDLIVFKYYISRLKNFTDIELVTAKEEVLAIFRKKGKATRDSS